MHWENNDRVRYGRISKAIKIGDLLMWYEVNPLHGGMGKYMAYHCFQFEDMIIEEVLHEEAFDLASSAKTLCKKHLQELYLLLGDVLVNDTRDDQIADLQKEVDDLKMLLTEVTKHTEKHNGKTKN